MNPKDIKQVVDAYNIKPNNPSVNFRGGQLSIQASEYNYCYPKHNHGPYSSFEVAYLVNNNFTKIAELPDRDDDVYGWVDLEVVIKLLLSEGYSKEEILNILPR